MKRISTTYWTTTAIIAFMMMYSAYAYLFEPALAQGFQHLGFPGYFRIELAVFKIAGAILLVAPVTLRVKEWVYAGFGIVFISAFIAHTASGDPLMASISPLVFLALLVTSYVTYNKRQLHVPAKKEVAYA